MASSTDSPGPITKTVGDAAIILSLLAGKDPQDATSSPLPAEDYSFGLEKIDPSQITLGIPKEYFLPNMDPQVDFYLRRAIKNFKKLGFRTKEVSLLNPKYSIATYTIAQRAEVSSNLARYDGIRYGYPRQFFGQEAKRRIMLGAFVLSAGYFDQFYIKAQKVRQLMIKDFQRVFKQVELLIAPTSPFLPLKIGQSAREPMFGEMQDVLVEASSLAGLPGISLNCGWANSLPVGMQIIAPQFKEKLILKIARFYEKYIA